MNKFCLILTTFTLFSCKKKWDPDEQFRIQAQTIQIQQKEYQAQLNNKAIINLKEFEREIVTKVRNGLSNQRFNDLVGFKYSLLAHKQKISQRWERRLYKWEDIVNSKWGRNSLEFKFCKKDREFFIITTNQQNIITVEYL